MSGTATDDTKLQFRLRSLFWGTLAVAVACAIAAPWLRRLEIDRQLRLGLLTASTLVFVTAFLVLLCYNRWKVERQSGKLLLRAAVRHRFWYHAGCIALLAFWLLSWGMQAWKLLAAKTFSYADLLNGQPILVIYLCLSYVIVVVWWRLDPTAIEAREQGLILGGKQFVPWSNIQNHRWGGAKPSNLTLQLPRYVMNLRVAPADQARLDTVLAKHVGAGKQAETATA